MQIILPYYPESLNIIEINHIMQKIREHAANFLSPLYCPIPRIRYHSPTHSANQRQKCDINLQRIKPEMLSARTRMFRLASMRDSCNILPNQLNNADASRYSRTAPDHKTKSFPTSIRPLTAHKTAFIAHFNHANILVARVQSGKCIAINSIPSSSTRWHT